MGENDSLAEFLAVAVDAAKIAGEIIRKGFYQKKNVEHKGQVDLVTETDKACEDVISQHLKRHFPNHEFIGEETSAAFGTAELTDQPTWIVDPLDGTTNFVHGFPFVCVSIGLTIAKVPTVGVVYNPIIDELFTGILGQGAFLNGKRIKASSQTELVKSLLATEVYTCLFSSENLFILYFQMHLSWWGLGHDDDAVVAPLFHKVSFRCHY
eukprot:TRINITY_DN9631_c0_g1_i4.p1 TRINITY_DN9631_c0_g1~~TRINITY_DN9631_c0_g1_i4.p1  ORF type:complete len:210 (+),score=42.78 TRINITY_DN9631_c0_g1_i4:255-884(+)